MEGDKGTRGNNEPDTRRFLRNFKTSWLYYESEGKPLRVLTKKWDKLIYDLIGSL